MRTFSIAIIAVRDISAATQIDFKIRPALGDDLPFIYSTWLNSYAYSRMAKEHHLTIYYQDYKRVIDGILERSDVSVACKQDEDNLIFSYLVKEKNLLHYCFTKGPFTRLGLASALLHQAFPDGHHIFYTHKTSMFKLFSKGSMRFTHRATLLYKTSQEINYAPRTETQSAL